MHPMNTENPPLRLGTRSSPLALWQAHFIQGQLASIAAPRAVELELIETHGDRDQASALSAMGGFGVFTKAIQNALLHEDADIAVHSLKDLPTIPVEGLELAGVPQRGPTGDAFVSRKHARFDDLPRGAVVGTSSLRRRAQLLNRRPDLKLIELRGNVDTRLRKLDEQNLDAIILAEAGLIRLGLQDRITEVLDSDWMLPAVGQGAIGLECRRADEFSKDVAQGITDPPTWQRVQAERAMLAALGGGCLVPIGSTSRVEEGVLTLRGAVLSEDGRRRVVGTHSGPAKTPLAVGLELAGILLSEGAGEILQGVRG
jgi:hydroxymethylbilane synthase